MKLLGGVSVGGIHWRCVTLDRSHERHPIFQVTHPCMLAAYIGGA
ncbi:hypothetical protein [Baaleninema simplex]|nr:hypothetical protein [Baaleninema simplex]